MPEQRNPHHGTPPRAPLRLRLVGADGSSTEKELLADTGNPYALIINSREMQRLRLLNGADVNTNFGLLEGGWLRVVIPEISFDRQVFGYGSDEVVAAA